MKYRPVSPQSWSLVLLLILLVIHLTTADRTSNTFNPEEYNAYSGDGGFVNCPSKQYFDPGVDVQQLRYSNCERRKRYGIFEGFAHKKIFLVYFHDFQDNDVIIGEKVALFGGTSTQIIYIGSMYLSPKFHAFSTIFKIFSPSNNIIIQRTRNRSSA